MSCVPTEQREHKRYPLTDDTVISCAINFGQVIDISEGGLAIKYINLDLQEDCWQATLHCREKKLLIKELPLKLTHVSEIQFSPFSPVYTQTVGVKFNGPSDVQKDQIRQLIATLE